MSEVKRYHVTETGLVEGTALGRLGVVLEADFDRVAEAYVAAGEREHSLRTRIAQLEQSEKQMQETVDLALSTGTRVAAERDALQQRLNAADQRIDELTAKQAESRTITLSGCDFSEHELIRTAVRMVTGTSRRGTLRWVAMKDAFCCGSGVAHALCRRFGFDPDETVKP